MHRAFVLSVLVSAIGVIPGIRYSLVNEPIAMASVLVIFSVACLTVAAYAAKTTGTLADFLCVTWPLSAGTCAVLLADLAIVRAPLLQVVLTVCLVGGASAAFSSVALIGTFLFIRGLERPERKALIVPSLLIAAGLIPTVLGAAFFFLLG